MFTCCLYAAAEEYYVYVTASQSNVGTKAKVALSGSIPEGMSKEYGSVSIGQILNKLADNGYRVVQTGYVGYANKLFSSFLLSKTKDNEEVEEQEPLESEIESEESQAETKTSE